MSGCGQGVFDSGGSPLLPPGYPVLFFSNASKKALLSSSQTLIWGQNSGWIFCSYSATDSEGAEQENTLDSL